MHDEQLFVASTLLYNPAGQLIQALYLFESVRKKKRHQPKPNKIDVHENKNSVLNTSTHNNKTILTNANSYSNSHFERSYNKQMHMRTNEKARTTAHIEVKKKIVPSPWRKLPDRAIIALP